MTLPRLVSRYAAAVLCATALLVCALIAHPVAEMGVMDDWSYIYSAKRLAETGHVVYNGWATAMVGWQLYLGAAFFKIFGFSFTTARVAVLLVGMATAVLLQRTLVRMGVNEWNATVGTLTIALSPLFQALTFTFMTDAPGAFALLLCLYLCLRAVEAKEDRTGLWWLGVAAVTNMGLGTVRQTSWLGVLVLVPATAWVMRRRRGALAIGTGLWVMGGLVVLGCLSWFTHQPYSVPEQLLERAPVRGDAPQIVDSLTRSLLAMCFLLLPVLAGFVESVDLRSRRTWRLLGIATGVVLVAAILVRFLGANMASMMAPFSIDTVTKRGIFDLRQIEGARPIVLGTGVRLAVTLATVSAGVCCAVVCLSSQGRRVAMAAGTLRWGQLIVMLTPLAFCYAVLLLPRAVVHGMIYDRYLLPLLLLAVGPLLLLFQERAAQRGTSGRLPLLSVGLVLLLAVFGIAGVHDVFSMYRARLAALHEVLGSGVGRSAIRGGWDYDGWTEIEDTGYVNEPKMSYPAAAYQRVDAEALAATCGGWFASYTPSIDPQFALSFERASCKGPTPFEPVPFTTWLPPYGQRIFVVQAR